MLIGGDGGVVLLPLVGHGLDAAHVVPPEHVAHLPALVQGLAADGGAEMRLPAAGLPAEEEPALQTLGVGLGGGLELLLPGLRGLEPGEGVVLDDVLKPAAAHLPDALADLLALAGPHPGVGDPPLFGHHAEVPLVAADGTVVAVLLVEMPLGVVVPLGLLVGKGHCVEGFLRLRTSGHLLRQNRP